MPRELWQRVREWLSSKSAFKLFVILGAVWSYWVLTNLLFLVVLVPLIFGPPVGFGGYESSQLPWLHLAYVCHLCHLIVAEVVLVVVIRRIWTPPDRILEVPEEFEAY